MRLLSFLSGAFIGLFDGCEGGEEALLLGCG